jgi:hypothetical protein
MVLLNGPVGPFNLQTKPFLNDCLGMGIFDIDCPSY